MSFVYVCCIAFSGYYMFKESNFKEDIYLVYLTKCVSLFVTAAAIRTLHKRVFPRTIYMCECLEMETYTRRSMCK